jgi:site-specific recombinase XerD
MSGCRPLSDLECRNVEGYLTNLRDRCLFILGIKTGFRIIELLSLRIKDVYENDTVKSRVKVLRRNMKGKTASREVILHNDAKVAIYNYVTSLRSVNPNAPLFQSMRQDGPITRQAAHDILKKAYREAKLEGRVATHSMRKTLAKKVYDRTNHDLIKVKEVLGHSAITTTVKYLTPNQDEIDSIMLE